MYEIYLTYMGLFIIYDILYECDKVWLNIANKSYSFLSKT